MEIRNLSNAPLAIGVIGNSRPELSWIALAFAETIDLDFTWLQVTCSGRPPPARELEVLEQFGLDRVQHIDRADLLPENAGANLASFVAREGALAQGGADSPLAQLSLPEALLEAIGQPNPRPGSRALVLANFDYTLEFVPRATEYLDSVVEGLRRLGLTAIITLGGESERLRASFGGIVSVGSSPSSNFCNPTVDWSGVHGSTPDRARPAAATESTSEFLHRLRNARDQKLRETASN